MMYFEAGGGGGGSAPALAGGTAAPPVSDVGTDSGGQAGQSVVFNVQGDSFGPDVIRKLADGLNEFIDDGGKIGRIQLA